MTDKDALPSVMAAKRRRQKIADLLLVLLWVGVMLLVVGFGFLMARFIMPEYQRAANQAAQLTASSIQGDLGAQTAPATDLAGLPATLSTEQAAALAFIETPFVPSIISYEVQAGDALASIAERYDTDLTTLMALNPSITPELLTVGDEIKVPARPEDIATSTPAPEGEAGTVEYTVVPGDTLAGIAAYFGSTVDAIVQLNNMESPDQLQQGQTLTIPVEPGAALPGSESLPPAAPELTATATPEG